MHFIVKKSFCSLYKPFEQSDIIIHDRNSGYVNKMHEYIKW